MKKLSFLLIAFLLVYTLGPATREANAGERRETEETSQRKKDEKIQETIRHELDEMWPMLFGTPRGEEKAKSMYGNNPVTSPENPLLTDEDRARALEKGAQIAGGEEELKTHIAEHMKGMCGNKPTLAQWYREIAKCNLKVCPVIVGAMINAHIEHVSQLPHDIILFDFDSYTLRPEGERLLEEVGIKLVGARYADKKVVLVGRASRIGGMVYNRGLSRKRADMVKDKLLRLGIAPNDITIIWLGWEPPQLTTEILDKYGLAESLLKAEKYGVHASLIDPYAINQSTMVVIY